MDEKDLLIFLTLADTGNLTRTAEKLYLSQPTLSKRLQNMEADLGAALFLRSKQGVTLTPAGEAAREVIQRTARELNTLREQLQMRKDTICGTLRIEVSIDYSKYRLPQVLAAYTVAESQIESLVVAKGYADCVAFMGEDSVSVVVSDPDGLDAVDVARIKDIVVSETSYTPDQIRIMEAGASAASQTGSAQEAEVSTSAAQTDEQADDAK